MSKSGLSDSPFFALQPVVPIQVLSPIVQKPSENVPNRQEPASTKQKKVMHRDTMTPRHHDTVVSSNRGITIPSNHDTTVLINEDSMIETIRKAVKELGKEAATHRFTVEEKKSVSDLIYSYKSLGIKTNENELARIALNYILEDYKQNGQNSILDKILKELNK